MDVLRRGQKPSDLITRESLENAILAVAASGGSTNAVLHLLAVAREAGVPLDIDDFDRIAESTPEPVRPQARRALRRHRPARRRRHRRAGQAARRTSACCTRTRRPSPARRSASTPTRPRKPPGQEVIRPLDNPIKKTGGIAILRGNLAPEGSVVKLSGHERRHHTRPGARLRGRGGDAWPRSRPARSTPATSSSSATRAPPAAPACARCSPSPPRSWGRGSATPSR